MRRVPVPLLPRWVRIGCVLLASLVIFYFSVLDAPPQSPPGSTEEISFKQLHILAYAGLGLSIAYATAEENESWIKRVILALGVPIVYGVIIELVQAPLPNRYFAVGDMVSNTLGAAIVIVWLALESGIGYTDVFR